MKIAMIGAGSLGKALAKSLKDKHEVTFGVRNTKDDLPSYQQLSIAEAAEQADVIVLAVPWGAVPEVCKAIGSTAPKPVIDASNPVVWDANTNALMLDKTLEGSGAQMVQQQLPSHSVVKTFNQLGASAIINIAGYQSPPLMFLTGSDDTAVKVGTQLVADAGLQPRYVGPLENSYLLDSLAMLWIWNSFNSDDGRDFALAQNRLL